MENAPGYVGYLGAGMEKDVPSERKNDRWANKMALSLYISQFEEAKELVEMKKSARKPNVVPKPPEPKQGNIIQKLFKLILVTL